MSTPMKAKGKSKAFSPDLLRDLQAEPALKPVTGEEEEVFVDDEPQTAVAPMSRHEERRLEECEQIIDRGLATFIEVGQALGEIRNRRLYRSEHKTFEAYCHERWNLKRQRAYEIMGAGEVARNLSEISDILPRKESHAATLTKLSPEEQRETWTEIVEESKQTGEKVTAATIKQKVDAKLRKTYSAQDEEQEAARQQAELLRKDLGKAIAKSAPDLVLTVSGSWLLRNNLSHLWREYRGTSQSINAQYSDQLTLQDLLDLGVIKINRK